MTHDGPNLLTLLDQLGTEAVPAMDAERSELQKQRVILAIEARANHVRERAFTSRVPEMEPPTERVPSRTNDGHSTVRKHLLGWAIGFAATVAMAYGGWQAVSTDTTASKTAAVELRVGRVEVIEGVTQVIRPGDYETRVSGSFELGKGDWVHTASGARAEVTLVADVRVELAADTQLRLGDGTNMNQSDVWLKRGKARFDVAKRPPNGKFLVHAPDADVAVHGTNFVVEVKPVAKGTQTTVSVTEGRVSVYDSGTTHWLGAGDRWASHVEPTNTEASSAVPTLVPSASEPPRVTASPRTEASVRSTLGEESAAFTAAMTAKRRGDDEAALRQLDEFLRRFPKSQLVQNARVERFRLLKHLGRVEQAASAAREYMAEDPAGFARDEARGLAIAPSAGASPLTSPSSRSR